MAERRRYTKRQKVTAVMAAEMVNPSAAAEQTGIPRTTLLRWMASPEMDALRHKTREEMAEDATRLAHLAYAALSRKIMAGEIEGRDLVMAYGVATDKSQLLAGAPTQRTETRSLSDTLPDHEKEALADAIDAWIKERDSVDA